MRFPSLEDLQQTRITPGIALSSVQAVVDMYEGMLRYKIKDGIFQASVTGNHAF
ncbi:GHKL domain-containing protein [Enterococcus sp. 669A]|uniref:GHKL domain-containing protein n=1 Tax=Candidatus Enterococcus moelleringii TaxID=2815325 RepID=A0ABS3LER4_9ENTE|nr:GHKL domain-containing protein [Enterococcus sp. 669A]MBO1308124.1 GHKL domain-containing protein [Enterococcus sp. 669A]